MIRTSGPFAESLIEISNWLVGWSRLVVSSRSDLHSGL